MPRTYKRIDCSKEDIIKLHKLSEDESNPRLATRARIVLGCAEGKQIKDIAAELHERPNTVITWRKRYSEQGIDGLLNLPRGYSGNRYGLDLRERILSKLNTSPPNGRERWTGNTLSDELGVPADVIWRCLRKEKIKLDEITPETLREDRLPDEIKCNIPLVLSVKENAYMANSKIATTEKMDLVLKAQVIGKDGNMIEKEIRIQDALPDISDFDLSTKEGFLKDFHEVEKSMLLARGQLTEDITKEYLDAASKKNETGKQPHSKKPVLIQK